MQRAVARHPQERQRICFGITGMDDQRQTGGARRRDMRGKARLLAGAVRLVVEIIESGFSDADDPGMAGDVDQRRGVGIRVKVGLVRVNTNRSPDIRLGIGQGDHIVPFIAPR